MASIPRAPPVSKPGPKGFHVPQNQTLYVTNLPSSKIQKGDLKTVLYMLFSAYGPVLDVVALKTIKMRGQAHIVFRDVQAATQAMRSLEGFQVLGREMRIQYAKSKSDAIAKLDGTYKLPSSAAAVVDMTETQQSVFNAPAPSSGNGPSTSAASHGLPARPPPSTDRDGPKSAGQKRPRDEEEEEEDSDEDVAMEEDSDDE